MSESEHDSQVQWLEDPPETWADAPDSPPERRQDTPEVTTSQSGGLLLREYGSRSRFLFTSDPVAAEE